MVERVSLRDYQRELAARLSAPEGALAAPKLAVQVGRESWLVDLADAGEVLPVPAVSALPLTRPWFRGVANVRGNLYSVIDFAAFLGGTPVVAGERTRLLLLGERFKVYAALLVDATLGLRSPDQFAQRSVSAGRKPWVRAEFSDKSGAHWRELDVAQLVQDAEFLSVGA
jgi:twitching motility protein PilI